MKSLRNSAVPTGHLRSRFSVSGSSRPIHVLVVDDEPALRKVFRTSLAASGFVIEEARSGEEAVDTLPQHAFDLVLLDINMPGIGGVEACREIRALAPRIGILMVTVRDAEHDMVRALEAGADDYATKPVRFRELVARMRAVLRRLDAGRLAHPARRRPAGQRELLRPVIVRDARAGPRTLGRARAR